MELVQNPIAVEGYRKIVEMQAALREGLKARHIEYGENVAKPAAAARRARRNANRLRTWTGVH